MSVPGTNAFVGDVGLPTHAAASRGIIHLRCFDIFILEFFFRSETCLCFVLRYRSVCSVLQGLAAGVVTWFSASELFKDSGFGWGRSRGGVQVEGRPDKDDMGHFFFLNSMKIT